MRIQTTARWNEDPVLSVIPNHDVMSWLAVRFIEDSEVGELHYPPRLGMPGPLEFELQVFEI